MLVNGRMLMGNSKFKLQSPSPGGEKGGGERKRREGAGERKRLNTHRSNEGRGKSA